VGVNFKNLLASGAAMNQDDSDSEMVADSENAEAKERVEKNSNVEFPG